MDPKIKKVGLMGDPVSHSVSPAMHNAAFVERGLPYQFELFRVTATGLQAFLEELRTPDWLGVNVTIPHKEAVIPYLDQIDGNAKIIGAVNIIRNQNGKLVGKNTDGEGFIRALAEEVKPLNLGEKHIVILGAGGSARAITFSLLQNGAKSIAIINRSRERAEKLKVDLSPESPGAMAVLPGGGEDADRAIQQCDILINTTSVGMYPNISNSPLPDRVAIGPHQLIVDIIFNPPETILLKSARARGAKTIGGLGMLVYQGALSFQIFTGLQPPVEVMRGAAQKALRHGP